MKNSKPYQAASCGFYEFLIEKATFKILVDIVYLSDNTQISIKSIIIDVFTKKGEEFIKTESEKIIRLDTLVYLDLTINDNNYTVNNTGYVLTANQSGASYQWMSCEDSLLIPNETNQTFSPTTNGDYAVIVTNNGCTDTSSCYSIVGLGITKNGFNEKVLIYPNPTNGNFSIDLGEYHDYIKVTIVDVLGEIIQSKRYNNSQILNINLHAPSGVYTATVETDHNRTIIKLIKE